MESRNILSLGARYQIKTNTGILVEFDKNGKEFEIKRILKYLQALEKCEKLIIDIENLMQRNHLMRDEDNETVNGINDLLVNFGMLQFENGLTKQGLTTKNYNL